MLDIGHAEKCIHELYEVTEDSVFLIFGSEEGPHYGRINGRARDNFSMPPILMRPDRF